MYPSLDGVLTTLQKVSKDGHLSCEAVNSFNSSASPPEREMLLNLLADPNCNIDKARKLLRQLKLFSQAGSGQAVSVDDVSLIAPESLPPIQPPPMPLLICDQRARFVALRLGAQEVSLTEIVSKMLEMMRLNNNLSSHDTLTFMVYFLDNRTLVGDPNLLSMAKQVKFVQTRSGKLKAADELYSPCAILEDFFQAEDKFPCQEVCQTQLLDKLKQLGLRDESSVRSADLIETAQHIEKLQEVGETQSAKRKAEGLWKLLVRYGESIHSSDASALLKLSTVHCIPRLQDHEMPAEYPSPLPLTPCPVLVSAQETCDYSYLRLYGSVLPVVRPGLPDCVATGLKVGSKVSLDHVLKHLNNMIQLSKQQRDGDGNLGLILGVCANIYQYLTQCLVQPGSDGVAKNLADCLSSSDVVWTDTGFIPPWRVAFRSNYDCRPYLFQLEAGLQQYRPFLQAIGVQETFSSKLGVWVLQQIQTEACGRTLGPDKISLVNRAAQLLCEAVKTEKGSLAGTKVFLPDCNGVMQRADQLCFGDSPWLEMDTVKFVHDSISVDTARVLGVKTRKRKVYDELVKAIPFGQKEKLTDRIKGLLQGYTIDSSLFKELVQNADDAGATEIRFIKNFRNFGLDRIPEGWEKLQGPALCVYNNRSFTSRDMEGIHNLGRGSKGTDLLKTGQYGVGFNAVYHITDTPSFWTLQDDMDEVICVFDPSCQYLPDLNPYEPGVKFEDVDGLKLAYPDLFAAYIKSGVNMNQPGTLFRFPLRTEEMAKTSDIKNEAVTADAVSVLLENFKPEMGICLLFLNNINCIGIYSSTETGELVLEYAAKKIWDDQSSQMLVQYKNKLQEANTLIEGRCTELMDIPASETVLRLKLCDSLGRIEDWLIVNKVGFSENDLLSQTMLAEWQEENFRLMPRGGVAVQLSRYSQPEQQLVFEVGDRQAFCMLPLPVRTGLPVHINGHFALDHETRRSLWDNKDDARTEWNKAIALQVIVPAYLVALQHARQLLFPDGGGVISSGMNHQLSVYHQLFPDLTRAVKIWRRLGEELYRQLARQELAVFPVVHTDTDSMEWVPVVRKGGQPGFFCNIITYFQKVAGGGQQTADMSIRFLALLKGLNMKVLDATPFRIMDCFQHSGVENVREVSPMTVRAFLKTGNSSYGDGCNVGHLPHLVENTPFQSAANVQTCLLFLSVDENLMGHLEGLPLSLRQSGNLYYFQKAKGSDKPVVSSSLHALPGSADLFLHQQIFTIFQKDGKMVETVQDMLQELKIPMLARMLPRSIPPEQYKTGQPCTLVKRQKWLRDIWKFLETQLQTLKDEEGIACRQKIEKEIQCLSEWSLIPVKMREQGTEQLLLYPVKDMHRVVYLPKKRDECHPELWDILRQLLSVPLLELSELPTSSAATKIVASTSHPVALLHALSSCGNGLTTSPPHARAVLSFFSGWLPVLEELLDRKELCRKLKRLPFFTTVDGNIIAIPEQARTMCLTITFPKEGLGQWSLSRREPLVLLTSDTIPDNLSQLLQFESPSAVDFYCKFLLPTLSFLPKPSIPLHMAFLKIQYHTLSPPQKEALCRQLKITPFLHVDGELYKANRFFSPQERVFQQMCSDCFPPAPYCNEEWNTFMKSAGLVCEVTEEMFVRFAHKVQSDAESGITRVVAARSLTLTEHLFQREKLTSSSLLQQVRDIRFLCPSEWMNSPDGQFLAQIASPFNPGRLVSFAESCSERHVTVVWSASCVVHPAADPTMLPNKDDSRWLKEVLCQLGWLKCAPKDKVLQHVHNVCSALVGKAGEERFASLGSDSAKLNALLLVMSNLYEYLEKYLDTEELEPLKQLPLIYSLGRRQMLMPCNVVVDLREEEAIEGFIYRAPSELGKFFSLFLKLGVTQHVTANHYAKVLTQLKMVTNEQVLHVEEMKIVRKAVEGVFRCLRSNTAEQKTLTENLLFFPSENLQLVESSKLVFKDDENLGDRFRKLQIPASFFLGFKKLEIHVARPEDEVQLLPQQHQMVWLSHIVKEVVPQEVKAAAGEGAVSRDLTDTLVRPECVASVVRLAYHQHKHSDKPHTAAFTEDKAQQIKQRLTLISLREVGGLTTVLEWNGRQVPGSELRRGTFMETSEEGGRTCTLYLDSAECRLTGQSFTSSLALAVQFVLKFNPAYAVHLQVIFENPSQAAAHLDAHSIEHFSLGSMEDDSIFPPPGTFIPVDYHCYLDNNISMFYSGEHVGFEVYDPFIDAEGEEAGDAVYIYAKVLREVRQDVQADTSPMFRRYLVDLGPERGKAEVHATQLYKFIRKSSASRTSAQRPAAKGTASIETIISGARDLTVGSAVNRQNGASPGQSSSSSASASRSGAQSHKGNRQEQREESATGDDQKASAAEDMGAVLKEIRQILTEAWKLPDEKERRRVWKRLMLKWHPDKNPGRKEFCTKVVQTIQRYVQILDSGRPLLDDDNKNKSNPSRDRQRNENQNTNRGSSHSSGSRGGAGSRQERESSSSRFYSYFYENMFQRGRTQRESYERGFSYKPSGTGDAGDRKERNSNSSSRSSSSSSSSGGSQDDWRFRANPQPGEARRWFRQAEADMTTAQAVSAAGTRGYNWVCYLAFQAVQKALTAVLYYRDANIIGGISDRTQILQLARLVNDPTLTALTKALEEHVGSIQRMRYPSMFSYPHIPDEIYKEDDARRAFETAAQVLERLRALPH